MFGPEKVQLEGEACGGPLDGAIVTSNLAEVVCGVRPGPGKLSERATVRPRPDAGEVPHKYVWDPDRSKWRYVGVVA